MLRMRALGRLIVLSTLVAASASCGDVVREGRSPLFLVMDALEGIAGGSTGTPTATLNSDVVTEATTPDPCSVASPCLSIFDDFAKAGLRLVPKDQSFVPTSNNQVTITRYHVSFRRADGRNTPGVDVPFDFDGAINANIPQTGTASLAFELVRHSAKLESPLIQLRNGNFISTIAEVTLYGKDLVGNDTNISGSLSVNFGNFADKAQ
jgi:hypothetical protein